MALPKIHLNCHFTHHFTCFSDISLDNAETGKKKKKPRKILMCSDGLYEEYSTGIDWQKYFRLYRVI